MARPTFAPGDEVRTSKAGAAFYKDERRGAMIRGRIVELNGNSYEVEILEVDEVLVNPRYRMRGVLPVDYFLPETIELIPPLPMPPRFDSVEEAEAWLEAHAT